MPRSECASGTAAGRSVPAPTGRKRTSAAKAGVGAKAGAGSRTAGAALPSQTTELVQARNAAVAADRARTAFFAALSHDLRTPIHGVLAAVDQLREEPVNETAKALIDTIEMSTHELLERLDELLLLAQPPENANLHPVAARIPEVLSHALTAYARLFPDSRNPVQVDIDPSLEQEVLVQKAGFLRVVDALFAEFMLLPDPAQVRVTMTLRESLMVLEVDGLDAALPAGGWALVDQAVTAVQGQLVSHSDPVRVTIKIPATPTSTTRCGRGTRVLLVDDTAVIRNLGQAIVQSMGYAVDVADGGRAALAAVAAHEYGLVLMDVRMPDVDGLTTVAQIRAGEAGPAAAELPIVALTAHAIAGAREEALMAGMDDFVTKPFSRDSLAPVLARFLPIPADES